MANDDKSNSTETTTETNDKLSAEFYGIRLAITAIGDRVTALEKALSKSDSVSAEDLQAIRDQQRGALSQDETERLRAMLAKWYPHDMTAPIAQVTSNLPGDRVVPPVNQMNLPPGQSG